MNVLDQDQCSAWPDVFPLVYWPAEIQDTLQIYILLERVSPNVSWITANLADLPGPDLNPSKDQLLHPEEQGTERQMD